MYYTYENTIVNLMREDRGWQIKKVRGDGFSISHVILMLLNERNMYTYMMYMYLPIL